MASSGVMIPWVADSGSYDIRVAIGGTAETITINFTAGRQYWRSGDGTADSAAGNGDLLRVIADAINADHSQGGNVSGTVVVLATDSEPRARFTISSSTLQIQWANGATTFPPEVLGFTASNTADAATITAPNHLPGLWQAQAALTEDSRERSQPRRGVRESLSGLVYASSFGEGAKRRDIGWTLLNQRWVLEEYEQSDHEAFEPYWVDWISKGERFRLYEQSAASGDITGGSFSLYRAMDVGDPMQRSDQYPVRWDVRLQTRAAT